MALCHRVVESLERFSYLNFSSTLFVYCPKLHAKDYEWESVVTWGLGLDRAYKEVSVIQQQAENWATLQAMNLAAGSMGYIIGLFIDMYIHVPNGKSVSFFSWPELKSTANMFTSILSLQPNWFPGYIPMRNKKMWEDIQYQYQVAHGFLSHECIWFSVSQTKLTVSESFELLPYPRHALNLVLGIVNIIHGVFLEGPYYTEHVGYKLQHFNCKETLIQQS